MNREMFCWVVSNVSACSILFIMVQFCNWKTCNIIRKCDIMRGFIQKQQNILTYTHTYCQILRSQSSYCYVVGQITSQGGSPIGPSFLPEQNFFMLQLNIPHGEDLMLQPYRTRSDCKFQNQSCLPGVQVNCRLHESTTS